MRPFFVSFAVSATLLFGCDPGSVPGAAVLEEAAPTALPIIHGVPTTDYSEVVAVLSQGICTGTVIGPRTVLTAKHCIDDGRRRFDPREIAIVVGSNAHRSGVTYQATQVFAPGGRLRDEDLLEGNDIALVNVDRDIAVPIREIARSSARRGMPITIVGFGRTTTTSHHTGTKYMGTTTVTEIFQHVFRTSGMARTCQGDSGGPAFDAAGRVIGITSFGTDAACIEDVSYYTETAHHLDLIAEALGAEPACTPRARECNQADDDCDGRVDTGCGELGADCLEASECMSGQCRRLQDRMICTESCVPFDEAGVGTCPDGFYCDVASCAQGACAPGRLGSAPDGASCARDTECVSGHCQNLAAGGGICGRPCRVDGDACPAGLSCMTQGLSCGVCATGEVPLQPFGAACERDAECLEGTCDADGFCTRGCNSHDDCPGFRCGTVGLCEAGSPARPGELCEENEDCQSSLVCALVDGDRVCTRACEAGCPEGTECDRDICLPPGAVLGEECSSNEECRSGICAGVCTRICDDVACPEGFECRPAGPASGCFPLPPSAEESSGGCQCRAGGASEPLAFAGLGLLMLAVRARRFRR